MPCPSLRPLCALFSHPPSQVRCGLVREDGQVETRRLARHQGRAHKLALDGLQPNSFFSCGEDGLVYHVSPVCPWCTLCVKCRWTASSPAASSVAERAGCCTF